MYTHKIHGLYVELSYRLLSGCWVAASILELHVHICKLAQLSIHVISVQVFAYRQNHLFCIASGYGQDVSRLR